MKNYISASLYRENTIEIPYSRLKTFLKKGDYIFGHCGKVNMSAYYAYFTVTHVAWWGVYAVCSDEFKKNYWHNGVKDKYKGHHKFKWENINGVLFKEGE